VTLHQLKSLIERNRTEIFYFGGYVAVSASALCVDFLVYWAMLTIAKFAFVAAIAGYCCGVLFHYALSSRIVFSDRFYKRGFADEAPALAKFFAAGASGLVVTAVIVGVLSDVAGFNPLVAKIVASGCSFVSVFLSLRVYVFNEADRTFRRQFNRDEPCSSPTMG
jgi:putative flippase GtrA